MQPQSSVNFFAAVAFTYCNPMILMGTKDLLTLSKPYNKMNKHNKTFIPCLLMFALLASNFLYAQNDPADRAGNRAKWKVNRKVDNKVDKTVDDAFDAVGSLFKKKNKESQEEDESVVVESAEEGVIVSDESSEVSVSFEEEDESAEVFTSDFVGSFTMEVTTTKNGKSDKSETMKMDYYLDHSRFAFRTGGNGKGGDNSLLIYDMANRTMTTVTDDGKRKQAVIMPLLKIKTKVKSEEVMGDNLTFTRTSETKEIEGYPCVKYLLESDEYTGTVWMTEAFTIDLSVMTQMVKVEGASGNSLNWKDLYGVEGTSLESHITNKKKNETYDAYYTNLRIGSIDAAVFDLSGYEVTDMSSMFGK